MNPRPLLVRAEAARLFALCGVLFFVALPPVFRWSSNEPIPPGPRCQNGAWWREDRVVCEPPGTPLVGTQALWAGTPLDLNQVDAEALMVVPGVGPALAQRIVADRAQNGPFGCVEAVERVKGVGPKLRRKLEPFVTVR